jgi:hypothetical protein
MGTRPYAGNSNLLGSLALDVRGQKDLMETLILM